MLTILLDFLIPTGIIFFYVSFISDEAKKKQATKWTVLGIAGAYITWRQTGYSAEQLGFTQDWTRGLAWLLATTLFGAALLIYLGYRNKRLSWNSTMTFAMVFYPVMGFAQQYLMLSYINCRLDYQLHWPPVFIALATAVAFCSLHAPNRRFMSFTFCLGFVFSLLFQSQVGGVHILLLSATHGWLGTLYYQYDLEGGVQSLQNNVNDVKNFLAKLKW